MTPPPASASYALRLYQRRLPLEPGRSYLLGSREGAEFRLGHKSVLPEHARIHAEEDGVRFECCHRDAVIRLDGEDTQAGTWKPGQELEVGDIALELEQLLYVPAIQQALTRKPGQEDFSELVWQELKRAPWFLISASVHALILFLIWLFCDSPIPRGPDGLTAYLQEGESGENLTLDEEATETIEAEELEDVQLRENELVEETEDDAQIERELRAAEALIEPEDLSAGMLANISGQNRLGDILREGGAQISKAFRDGVRRSRRNGLEIVFVFDSTGSMGSVLNAAKDRIARMLAVLQELVPFARVGVITYRDTGPHEDYLTRQVQLSRDFYRAINFMQMVSAGGGGDEPEAVYEGLQLAIAEQKWSPSARKLVILIGDAPPHDHGMRKIEAMARRFRSKHNGQIHAIITEPDSTERIAEMTRKTYTRIAKAGGGEALAFSDEAQILSHVMRLAFGQEESRSLEEVYRLADRRAQRTTIHGKTLAKGDQPRRLERAFRSRVVEHDVVKAILLDPRPRTLDTLIGYLEDRRFPPAGRHAASYILQRSLNLSRPPIDPVRVDSLSEAAARSLREMVQELPPR